MHGSNINSYCKRAVFDNLLRAIHACTIINCMHALCIIMHVLFIYYVIMQAHIIIMNCNSCHKLPVYMRSMHVGNGLENKKSLHDKVDGPTQNLSTKVLTCMHILLSIPILLACSSELGKGIWIRHRDTP